MILYRLRVQPSEFQGEGEDCDEWFTSLRAARRRRRELIRDNPDLTDCRIASDYEVERVELADLPPRELALAILNRRGAFLSCVEVVPAYEAPWFRRSGQGRVGT
jgi:hypothetical protein